MGGAVLLETSSPTPVWILMSRRSAPRTTQVSWRCHMIACSVVVMNIRVDLLYAWLDPRIRVSSAQG